MVNRQGAEKATAGGEPLTAEAQSWSRKSGAYIRENGRPYATNGFAVGARNSRTPFAMILGASAPPR
jgi:hypothetical protein